MIFQVAQYLKKVVHKEWGVETMGFLTRVKQKQEKKLKT